MAKVFLYFTRKLFVVASKGGSTIYSMGSQYERLKDVLSDANYDEALALANKWDLRNICETVHGGLLQLRFTCMIADVLDYGGRYVDAERFIQSAGHAASERLAKIKKPSDFFTATDDHSYVKQECWAVMVWGKAFYRRYAYPEALELFKRARDVLMIVHDAKLITCDGTLARAWYNIGEVERENHNYPAARMAFRQSIEFAEAGIRHRKGRQESTASFEYNMARCLGLGLGWIAYNEASLNDAMAVLILARHLMLSKRAKFMSAYIDLVQASIIMSESSERARIDDAIRLLLLARSTFAPTVGLGHEPFRLRADNELALAYLRRARSESKEDPAYNKYLREARKYIDGVKLLAIKSPHARRSYCTALIAEARVYRELGDPMTAIKLAEHAKTASADLPFPLIDANIGIGEAALEGGDVRKAISAFAGALKGAGTSRKVVAVCRLHLSRAYLISNELSKALKQFRLAEAISAGLENAFIQSLASRLRQDLSSMFQDFKLSKDDLGEWPHDKYLDWLRKWLADTAIAKDGNEKNAADRLHVDRATLKAWLKFERKLG